MWHLLLYSLYPVKLKVPSVCLASGYVVRFVQAGLGIPTPRATLVEQQLLAFCNSESMRLPVRFIRSSRYLVGPSSVPHFARATPLGSRRNPPSVYASANPKSPRASVLKLSVVWTFGGTTLRGSASTMPCANVRPVSTTWLAKVGHRGCENRLARNRPSPPPLALPSP